MAIKDKLSLLPNEPGCYLMKNRHGTIIYVGKAKKLKQRVRSYFTGAHNTKTTRLVSEIDDFEYVITPSEHESLILEMNLIKQHSPKYNIRLMDDKTYPYIELTEEQYPKLMVVRKKKPKGRLFGPFPNVYAARETVRMLNHIYPLRKCDTMPKKACLYYHIGQCLGPCIHPEVDYTEMTEKIIRFLKGDTKEVMQELKTQMEEASLRMNFEKAAEYRDLMKAIEQTTEKQMINLNDGKDRDMVSFAANEDDVAIQILLMRQGIMVDQHQIVFGYVGDQMSAVLNYLAQYYERKLPDEILFSEKFDEQDLLALFGNTAVMPKIGQKKKMVDIATKNAIYDLEHYHLLYRHQEDQRLQALDELSDIVGRPVHHIDIFDNAQLFGTAPISAMVVYKDQGFAKKLYRKYHLKTTTNDDYQAMKEVTYRRYQKMLIEHTEKPDLILIDGGIGHVRAAKDTLHALNLNIAVAGLKKDRHHQLEALVYKDKPIMLLKNKDLYKLLVSMSEEVHRFAITFHRQTRSRLAKTSVLDQVKGIGPKTKQKLLAHYKSLDDILNASDEDLKACGVKQTSIEALRKVKS